MREILFRGKRVDNGEWVYGDLSQIQCRVYISQFVLDDTYRDGAENKHLYKHIWVLPETVGQYTGLTDKNGKKIFEGDILTHKGFVVTYCNGMDDGYGMQVGWYIQQDNWERWVELASSYELKVIGNIHDNPELLEVAK